MTLAYMPTPEPQAPHNLDAEQALLGAILVTPREAMPIARAAVSPEDFYEGVHKRIFDIMIGFDREGRPADIRLLASALRDDPDITDGVSIPKYLAQLASSATTVVNVADYARIIRDLSIARQARDVADGLYADLEGDGALRPFDAVSEALGACDAILHRKDSGQRVTATLGEAIREAMTSAEERRDNRGEPEVSTGLRSLDRMLGGLWPGQVVVLGGRPAMGKSALMEYLMISVARQGRGAAAFSFEMGHDEFGFRGAAMLASEHFSADRLEYTELRQGVYTDKQARLVEDAARAADDLPIEIINSSGYTIHDIASRVRRIKSDMQRRGVDLYAVLIDYLQLITPSNRYAGNRNSELTEITTALKALAKQLGICIILLSQLSRNVEQREDKRPRLSDLRESGSIEQDADVVLFIYREEYYLKNKQDLTAEDLEKLDRCRNVVEINIAKQRHGPTGPVSVYGDLASNLFRDLEQRK